MPKYRRVSSFKIMNDYEMTAKHMFYLYKFADIKGKRFFRINTDKIEQNIMNSKLSNQEKNNLLMMINNKNYHQIHCYAKMLYHKYNKKHLEYKSRMNDLFMTIEDKTIFYA